MMYNESEQTRNLDLKNELLADVKRGRFEWIGLIL